MSEVVPRPNATQYRVVKDFHEAMASINATAKIGYTSLEGYIAGRVAAEAARVASSGGAVRRDNFRAALSGLNLDLGGYRVRFAGGSQTGSSMIDVVALDRYGRIIG